MNNVPELTTERLRLRGHRAEDFAGSYAMWSDPGVTRFIGGKPSTTSQTWSRLLAYAGHWSLMGFGYWMIEERATGAFVGEIGFADFKREIDPSMQNVPELGFALTPAMQRKGYASEALRAVIAWGDLHLPEPRTVALVNAANAASIRVLERAAYRAFRSAEVNGVDAIFYERIRPEASP